MERWHNKVAVVTGASSGIGAACAIYLVNNGMVVVGLARRRERIEELREKVKPELKNNLHAIKCDLQNEQEIIAAFKEIEKLYGPVAVLVNNAGIVRKKPLLSENNTEDLRAIIDTNLMGVTYCTREAYRSMKTNNDAVGHIFIINSIAGHKVLQFDGDYLNMYSPSKYAVTALTEVYRNELRTNKTNIKITSISPGAVKTEIISESTQKMLESLNLPMLQAEDIADALIYCLQTPPHVQIHELTIKPVNEIF